MSTPERGRNRYQAYVALVVLGGSAAITWGLLSSSRPGLLVALVASALIVEVFPARLRTDVTASLSAVVALTGMLLGGTPAAVVTGLGSAGSLTSARDRRLIRASFNSAQQALSALAAGLTYEMFARLGDDVQAIVAPRSLAALLAAMLVYSIVNHVLVAIVVTLDIGENFLDVFNSGLLPMLLQIPYAALSLFAGVLVLEVGPQSLLLIVVPAMVARTGLMAFEQVDEAYERLVRSFAKTIEIKDEYTKGHSERVSYLSDLLAGELRVGYEERRLVRYAAMLHDVGKIGVPLCVINKPGPLDDDEFNQMKQHPAIGESILRDIDFLLPVLDVVRHHHERLDGRGYPDGLAAPDLTQAVRIVTAVDAFDAMTSTRSYRRSLSVEEAVAELHACSGTQFDRDVVAALEKVIERENWQPTTTFNGEVADIPNVKYVKPLAERHHFVPEAPTALREPTHEVAP